MAFLLDHVPPHVHLVITTRADPPTERSDNTMAFYTTGQEAS